MNAERKTVTVIGGGIVGLSVAWRAAQHGRAVTVFDKGTLGSEASWAGAGMLAPGGEVHDDSPFSLHLIAARERYAAFLEQLKAESGSNIEFQTNGALDLAYSDVEAEELATRTGLQSQLGIESKPVTVEQVRSFWPRIRTDKLVAARFVPGDAVVNPRDVIAALRTCCERRGVCIRENTRVSTVNTSDADFTVIAAGAWSSDIRLEDAPPLPHAEPVRGHLIAYRQPLDTLATIVRRNGVYLLQRESGLLIAGASVERAGFDRTIDNETVQGLRCAAEFVIPHLGETTISEAWNGLRPGADDLYVGPWHSPRLLLAYGHFRNGILLAPWTADQIAEFL